MAERFLRRKITNKRLFPRYDFRVGISIKNQSDEIIWNPAISQNLSESGIHILHSRILVPDEPISIKIPLFAKSEMMSVKGYVSWVGIDDLFEDSPFWVTAGIKFENVKRSQQKSLAYTLANRTLLHSSPVRNVANKIDFVM